MMTEMNMIKALNSALEVQLEKDPNIVIFGEDVGFFGGVFRVTDGLQKKFGEHRVFDSPLAEGGIAAIAKPGAKSAGTSLIECTAISARPSSNASSTSLMNNPLPPTSCKGRSWILSPEVTTCSSSMRKSGW